MRVMLRIHPTGSSFCKRLWTMPPQARHLETTTISVRRSRQYRLYKVKCDESGALPCINCDVDTNLGFMERLSGPFTYLTESQFLTGVPLAKDGGMTTWILVDKTLPPEKRPILCSCQTSTTCSGTSERRVCFAVHNWQGPWSKGSNRREPWKGGLGHLVASLLRPSRGASP